MSQQAQNSATAAQEAEQEAEEIYSEDPRSRLRSGPHAEGATVALVIYQAQKSSEWGMQTAQRWLENSRIQRERKKLEALEKSERQELARLERQLKSRADDVFQAEAMASYAVRRCLGLSNTSLLLHLMYGIMYASSYGQLCGGSVEQSLQQNSCL
jgi:hypothetical protein